MPLQVPDAKRDIQVFAEVFCEAVSACGVMAVTLTLKELEHQVSLRHAPSWHVTIASALRQGCDNGSYITRYISEADLSSASTLLESHARIVMSANLGC